MNNITADESLIKRYVVKDEWKDFEVTLEVNHNRLTPEIATQINEFWGGWGDRLIAESSGDVVKTTIRLFGLRMIHVMLSQGGASFGPNAKSPLFDEHPGKHWSCDLQNEEGWGGTGGDPYGWCGIRVVAADVDTPDFEDLVLTEVATNA